MTGTMCTFLVQRTCTYVNSDRARASSPGLKLNALSFLKMTCLSNTRHTIKKKKSFKKGVHLNHDHQGQAAAGSYIIK